MLLLLSLYNELGNFAFFVFHWKQRKLDLMSHRWNLTSRYRWSAVPYYGIRQAHPLCTVRCPAWFFFFNLLIFLFFYNFFTILKNFRKYKLVNKCEVNMKEKPQRQKRTNKQQKRKLHKHAGNFPPPPQKNNNNGNKKRKKMT